MSTSRSLVGVAVAALAVTLAAGAAATTHATPGLRVQEYAVPPGTHPHDVAVAADGTVWYTAQHTGKLGRLDPKTGQTTEIPLGAGSAPHGVIVGPDGAAWVTDGGLNAIVRVDPGRPRFADSACPLDGLREPQHGDVRQARDPLVHRAERHLRAPRS